MNSSRLVGKGQLHTITKERSRAVARLFSAGAVKLGTEEVGGGMVFSVEFGFDSDLGFESGFEQNLPLCVAHRPIQIIVVSDRRRR